MVLYFKIGIIKARYFVSLPLVPWDFWTTRTNQYLLNKAHAVNVSIVLCSRFVLLKCPVSRYQVSAQRYYLCMLFVCCFMP